MLTSFYVNKKLNRYLEFGIKWPKIKLWFKDYYRKEHYHIANVWFFREGNGNPLQYSCLGNPVDRGAWWAAIYGVAQSLARLKRLTMHSCIGGGNGNPLQYSCLENPRDRRAWWAAMHGVPQSRTQLKWLSSSSGNVWFRIMV